MAGATVNGSASLASGGTLLIQPASGVEWLIKNIYYDAGIQVDLIDGSVTISSFDSDSAKGCMLQREYHLTNTHYLRISGVSNPTNVSYDGIVWNP